MRLVIDTLIAVMLVVVLGVLVLRQRGEQAMLDSVANVQQSIRAIESQSLYRAALGEVDATPTGFAVTLESTWFDSPPQNELVADHRIRLWSDAASLKDADRLHPRRITAIGGDASFWYNANRGIVRARVPDQMSQQATVDLYNLVNGTSVRVDDVDWVRRDAIAAVDTPGSPGTPEPRTPHGLPKIEEIPVNDPQPEPEAPAVPEASAEVDADSVLNGLLKTNR